MSETEIHTTVRSASESDAGAIARMVAGLSAHHGSPECAFTAEHFRRDGLGPDRCFDALVAEQGGEPIGYAFFHASYDSETARRGSYLMDLFVRPEARESGAGRELLAAVARTTLAAGGDMVWWLAGRENEPANRFYLELAAPEPGWDVWVLAGEQMEELIENRVEPEGR